MLQLLRELRYDGGLFLFFRGLDLLERLLDIRSMFSNQGGIGGGDPFPGENIAESRRVARDEISGLRSEDRRPIVRYQSEVRIIGRHGGRALSSGRGHGTPGRRRVGSVPDKDVIDVVCIPGDS